MNLKKCLTKLYGFDFDQEGIDVLTEAGGKNLYRADLEKLDDVPLERNFRCHHRRRNDRTSLESRSLSAGHSAIYETDTELIITTINAYSGMRFIIYGLRGRGGANEPVHPDHVAYYSYKTLSLVLDREKLKVKDFVFYDVGPEHRQFNRWFYNLFNDVCVAFSPQLSDGVIAVCQLNGAATS